MSPRIVGHRIRVTAAVAAHSLGCGKSPPEPTASPQPVAARPAGASKPPPVLAADTDPRDLREGRQVEVTGRLVRIGSGTNEVLEVLDGPDRLTTATPVILLAIGRGEHVMCVFGEIDKRAFERWSAKNPPGTRMTIGGLYSRADEGYRHTLFSARATGDFPPPIAK